MPLFSAKKRRKQSELAKVRHGLKQVKAWKETALEFGALSLGIVNPSGQSRTFEENKLVLLALNMLMKMMMRQVEEGHMSIHSLSWTMLEEEVASSMHMKREHITELRKQFLEDGHVLVFGEEYGEDSKRGCAAKKYPQTTKLTTEHMLSIVTKVDDEHAKGATVTNRLLRNHIRDTFSITTHRSTMARNFRKLGLTWQKVKPKKKNIGAYRMDAIRDYLIKLNHFHLLKKQYGDDCDFVQVCTDETFLHPTHANSHSYLGEDSVVDKSNNKGRRLIVIHAISEDGPLCERIDGIPVDDLTWTGDTPHPEPREDGKVTAELLWLAQSSTGDYHDNMNSEMFMKWVVEKLEPAFAKQYPGKRMALIIDNAPYHHKRKIGSLGSKTKPELIQLCKEHDIEFLDLPNTPRRFRILNKETVEGVEDRGEFCRVYFDEDAMSARAAASKPFVPTLDELQIAMVRYMKEFRKELLECEIEAFMKSKGHIILWTPPYCYELQPMELYWATGKNHAADLSFQGRKMKQTVADLREGWYGNRHLFPAGAGPNDFLAGNCRCRYKSEVECPKLFETCVNFANKKFIPLCDGISGTIGNLVVDEAHESNKDGLPIDMFVIDLMKDGSDLERGEAEAVEMEFAEI